MGKRSLCCENTNGAIVENGKLIFFLSVAFFMLFSTLSWMTNIARAQEGEGSAEAAGSESAEKNASEKKDEKENTEKKGEKAESSEEKSAGGDLAGEDSDGSGGGGDSVSGKKEKGENSGQTKEGKGRGNEEDDVGAGGDDVKGGDQVEGGEMGRGQRMDTESMGAGWDRRGAFSGHPGGRRGRWMEDTGFRLNDPESWIKFRAALEMGFIGLPKHEIQFGKGTTNFDFLEDGGQDNLFFFWRIAARLVLFEKHNIKFLYQPLDLRTSSKLKRDIQIDTVTFAEGTPMQSRYGFDFYRATYLYRFLNRGGFQLSAGGGLQIRNARITFTSADGTQRFDSGNIGPVPLLSLEARYNINDRFWLETEIDGFYAWIKFVNGGDDPIVGAILDASLRAGFNLNHFIETFVNVRYIGGGARGTSDGATVPSDGYTNNWIHAVTLSLGLGVK